MFGRGAVGGWSGSVLEVVGGGEIPDSLVFACEEALEVMSEEMIAVEGEAELIVGGGEVTFRVALELVRVGLEAMRGEEVSVGGEAELIVVRRGFIDSGGISLFLVLELVREGLVDMGEKVVKAREEVDLGVDNVEEAGERALIFLGVSSPSFADIKDESESKLDVNPP